MNNLYKVRYITTTGQTRLGHVKAYNLSEATIKAKRFVIGGGVINSITPPFA